MTLNRRFEYVSLLKQEVANFNSQQIMEGDADLVIEYLDAPTNEHFRYWLSVWSDIDSRGRLLAHLEGLDCIRESSLTRR